MKAFTRKCSLLMVMLLAFTLFLSTAPLTVSAETTYQPIGGTTTFVKNLVVDDDANIPDASFTFTVKRGTPVEATPATDTTPGTIEILISNIGGSTVSTSFSNADTANTIPGVPGDTDPSNPTAGKKYAQKQVTVTFPDGSFTKPGVYRYEITEAVNTSLRGVTYDTNAVRYLDVFVTADDNNVLSVHSCVLRDNASTIGMDGAYTSDPDTKSSGYTNTLTQFNFEFSKTIAGNQGDKNKRFTFTLAISNANQGTYPIVATDVEGNPTSITVNASGKATAEYSLTNGSSLQVLGLNQDAVCTISEDPEDYTPTYTLDGGDVTSYTDAVAITLANDNHSVDFTNTRNGIIPTGVIMAIAPFAVGIVVFGAVLAFIVIKRKRRPY